MSDQPKPATGEWTEKQVMSLIDMGSGLSTVTRLTKAINAALAAERKEFEELEQLYRENNQDHYKEVGDLQQQLDAERSKYDRAQEQIRFQQQQLAKVKA